eukprot:TRINITY_DN27802_c0_g1_i1.p1 TRINITY_DN27802_c0_g1~~TRINITY_DN27802_c0_g1_i1.p1  ORF type:complete len:551 (+),score=114.19 TRINITY_DN27802_c0_g1_i1:24-1655(+)
MATAIPDGLFWFFLVINSGMFLGTIPIYFMRRNTFPIANRLPRLASVEMCVLSYFSIMATLLGALPDFECRSFTLASMVPANFAVGITTYRLTWLVLKDFITRKLILQTQSKQVASGSEEDATKVPARPKRTMFQTVVHLLSWFLEWYFETMLRFFRPKLVALIAAVPCFIIVLTETIIFSKIDRNQKISVFGPVCAQQAFSKTQALESALYTYLLACLLLGGAFLKKVRDNFGFGNEMRAILIPLATSGLLFTIVVTIPNAFQVLFTETRFWAFLIGCLLTPMAVGIQSVYPLYLSLEHQRKYPKAFRKRIEELMRDSAKKVVTANLLTDELSVEFPGRPTSPSPSSPDGSVHSDNSGTNRNIEFENWLESPEGRGRFLEFLQKEFSVENLLFWEASKAFYLKFSRLEATNQRDMVADAEAQQEATVIRDTFILSSASSSINISSGIRSEILQTFPVRRRKRRIGTVHIPSDLFQKANKEIFELMFRDSYTRYKMMYHDDECAEMMQTLNRTQEPDLLTKMRSLLDVKRLATLRDSSLSSRT